MIDQDKDLLISPSDVFRYVWTALAGIGLFAVFAAAVIWSLYV